MTENIYKIELNVTGMDAAPTEPTPTPGAKQGGGKSSGGKSRGGLRDVINYLRKEYPRATLAVGTAVGVAGTVISYAVGRVGVETGNYQLQNEVSAALKGIGIIGGLGAGVAFNPVLGGIAIGMTALTEGLKYRSYSWDRDYEGEMLGVRRERAGIGALSNRVRG